MPFALPRFVVAAPRSGEGKTTVALALMAAFARQGLRVQGFKVGPDYLDTTFQELATGRSGRNLDLWLMGADAVLQSLSTNGADCDVAIIEGVMGLFDGHRDGITPSSTADIAKLISAPIVLVIDASRMAASVGAVALGFKNFDPAIQIAGVILNRWTPGRDLTAVSAALERAGVPLLGTLERTKDLELPSRHLGLVGAQEKLEFTKSILDNLADRAQASIDLNTLFTSARLTSDLPNANTKSAQAAKKVRLGIARDNAFFFYYPENLEALENAGAELVFFSPCSDTKLPDNLDGIYFGGGYPEEHVEQLSHNTLMLQSVRDAASSGMPIYAECGGMLYLARSLTTLSEKTWPLAAVIPGNVHMHAKLQSMGYRRGTLMHNCILGEIESAVQGHEFHYSSMAFDAGAPATYRMEHGTEGYSHDNVTCSYLHVHFAGHPQFAKNFVEALNKFRAAKHVKENS